MSKNGDKFPVHRNVLVVQSNVLRRIFLTPMKERKTSCVQLQYETDIVRKFIKFLYEREIEKEEKEEGNLRCFLDIANSYDIPHLKEEVEELAIRKLTVENMVDMFFLADQYSAEVLRNEAEAFIRTNRLRVREGLAELEKLKQSERMKIMSICFV